MSVIDSNNIAPIVQRTLSFVDTRLIDHGQRVAFIVLQLLRAQGITDMDFLRDQCFLALLHDIGAYKTEEIDQMVCFETGNVWDHSVYGYLFIKYLSPLQQYAPIILFHHTDYSRLQHIQTPYAAEAQLLNLADRLDVLMLTEPTSDPFQHLEEFRGSKFSPEALDLLQKAEKSFHVTEQLRAETYAPAVQDILCSNTFSAQTIDAYLNMIIFAIDFRSFHTVTHTISTACISGDLGRLMQLSPTDLEAVSYGALLHDLGKIAIPVEILEHPGKLSPQAMRIMRTHVEITQSILGDSLREDVTRVALRHHEKLNGSGYPLGLPGNQLSCVERIVTVADIVSALSGTRSYKRAFDASTTLDIVNKMAAEGLIDADITALLDAHFQEILDHVWETCDPIIRLYHTFQADYNILLSRCAML